MTEKPNDVKKKLDIFQAKLDMHDRIVPCFFETVPEAGCLATATMLAYFKHFIDTDCEQAPLPLCREHMETMRLASGFWSEWFGRDPITCMNCETPIDISRVVKI